MFHTRTLTGESTRTSVGTGPSMVWRRLRVWLGLGLVLAAAAAEAAGTNGQGSRLHWAFQPPRPVPLPAVRQKAWIQSPVDAFILGKLEAQRLGPSRPADRRTLIRRATYDLTGLPPTPEAVERFLADDSPDAFARVVDRLLASPAHGERWGRHWLDVVRYADARDLIQLPAESDFREAWRYRDWVVRAHNADLPFGEFIRRQIAGDLMQPERADAIDADGWVATGMLAIADFVPGDVDKDRMIADYVNDEIDVVGRAILGLSLGCARCHDHKFDPITMEDYYGLAGIFFSTRLIPGPVKGNTPLVKVPLLCRAELDRIAEVRKRLGGLENEMQRASRDRDAACFDELRRLAAEQSGRYLVALAEFRRGAGPSGGTNPEAFAVGRGLKPAFLARWVDRADPRSKSGVGTALFDTVPGWAVLSKAAVDGRGSPDVLAKAALELRAALSESRRQGEALDAAAPGAAGWMRSEVARLRASDPRMLGNGEGRVTHWPSRARGPRSLATTASGFPGPMRTNVVVGGRARPVLRFSGKELMEIGVAVPPAGSLFVAFRRADREADGQRLVGWEDSDTGRHGLGLMLKAGGGLHAIGRADTGNGDVVAGASTNGTFEIVGITWGPRGTTLRRQGRPEGRNAGVARISADPEIPMLRIGGPGSGGAGRFAGDLAEVRVFDTPLDEAACARVEADLTDAWCGDSAVAVAASDPAEALLDWLAAPEGPFWLPEERRGELVPVALKQRWEGARAALTEAKAGLPAEIPQAVVVRDGGPAETRHAGFHDAVVFLRGDPKRPGKTVPRGFPAVIGGARPDAAGLANASGRRQLADWLVSPENPLASRVAVNRMWQHHFGEGIVRTATDFGARGERPTHPELLDYLAARFVESGGSAKAMHRLIMLSATYQQASEVAAEAAARDPENRLLSHANRRRLEAESIRDTLLAVSGSLTPANGGPAVQDIAAPCRSLHLMAVRTGAKSAFPSLFDAPDCGAIVERRSVSTVAPQALFLMNDAFVAEQARRLAARVKRAARTESPEKAIRIAYRQALGRAPSPDEIGIGLDLLRGGGAGDPLERYCLLLFCTNEFIYLD